MASDTLTSVRDRWATARGESPQSALRLIVCGSVGSGKSALIARLLDEGRSATCGQDMTSGAGHRQLSTAKRSFVVADAPGQGQFIQDLVKGASNSDLAIVVVDAREGLTAQALRHATILSLLGIRHVVLAVNKIDLVAYERLVFDSIVTAFESYAKPFGFQTLIAIPTSARDGDNLTSNSARTPWFDRRPLLATLEDIDIGNARDALPFRMPVQSVDGSADEARGIRGTIASGSLRPNDEIVIARTGRVAHVAQIGDAAGSRDLARAGDAVTLTLAENVDVASGDMLAASNDRPQVADQLAAHLIWMGRDPLLPGRTYLMTVGTRTVPASVTELKHRLDVETHAAHAAKTLAVGEIGFCNLATSEPIAFDHYAENRSTGAFVLSDRLTNEIAAAGMIAFALRRAANIHRQDLAVTKTARARIKRQSPAILWFTGLPSAGKSTIANLVEARLHALGAHTVLLDGDNVRHGLNKDLGFTDADRVENIRRVGEVAKLMTEAGLIVLCSFISPFRAERRMVRQMAENEFIEVFVDTPLQECIARDPKGLYKRALDGKIKNFTGIDQAYEPPEKPELRLTTTQESPDTLAQRVVDELRARKVILSDG